MRDTARAERLFLLFTSPDCAAAIAGDLTEERRRRGSTWFWYQVLGTTLALWRQSVAAGPLTVLLLLPAGFMLLLGPAWAGTAAIAFITYGSFWPVGRIALALCWWGGALWAGLLLVNMAPRAGVAACVLLAVIGEALLMAAGATLLWYGELTAEGGLLLAIALAAAVPLLAGGALARRRMVAWGVPVAEKR